MLDEIAFTPMIFAIHSGLLLFSGTFKIRVRSGSFVALLLQLLIYSLGPALVLDAIKFTPMIFAIHNGLLLHVFFLAY